MKNINLFAYFLIPVFVLSFLLCCSCNNKVEKERKKEQLKEEIRMKNEQKEIEWTKVIRKYGVQSDFKTISSDLFEKDIEQFKGKIFLVKSENSSASQKIENSKFYAESGYGPLTVFELDIPHSQLPNYEDDFFIGKSFVFKLENISYFIDDYDSEITVVTDEYGSEVEQELSFEDMIYRRIEGELITIF